MGRRTYKYLTHKKIGAISHIFIPREELGRELVRCLCYKRLRREDCEATYAPVSTVCGKCWDRYSYRPIRDDHVRVLPDPLPHTPTEREVSPQTYYELGGLDDA